MGSVVTAQGPDEVVPPVPTRGSDAMLGVLGAFGLLLILSVQVNQFWMPPSQRDPLLQELVWIGAAAYVVAVQVLAWRAKRGAVLLGFWTALAVVVVLVGATILIPRFTA